ncbi:MAG: pilus assembly protein [Rhodocyclaceae bacterium]|nr:pilus assembly protein [Rhodocyclaceae bacterium]
MKIRSLRSPSHRRVGGAATVEFALVSILLTMLVVATVDFARAMFVYDQLVKAARDGARYLSFFDPTIASEYPVAAAKSRMLYGTASAADGAQPIVPGLTGAMIRICDRVDSSACPGEDFGAVATASGSIDLVKVVIDGYTFSPIFPGLTRLGAVTFDPIGVTMRQLY